MIYNKSQLAPSQKMGMKAIALYAQLPSDLYVKVNQSDSRVVVFTSDRLSIPYLKQWFTHLPPHTSFISN